MKATIHIGTAKAGSSAIQYFLSKNRRLLRRAGYYVPIYRPTKQYGFLAYTISSVERMGQRRLRNQFGIQSQANLEAFQTDFAKKAQDDLERASGKALQVMLSAEGFANRSIEEIERLRDLLIPTCSGFTIVVYLRRQDLRRASGFRLGIKNHGKTDTDIFDPEFDTSLDYYTICNRWAQVFGDSAVFPRIFPDSAIQSYDLIDDFAQLTGIAETKVYQELKRPGRRNVAWDWRAVEFNRLMNYHLPALSEGKVPDKRKRLERILKQCFPQCVQRRPQRADAISFAKIYRQSNERLRARWFSEQASLFHEDFSMYPEMPEHYELSVEDAVYVASQILLEKRYQ